MRAAPAAAERCAAGTICPSWCPDPRCHFRGKFTVEGRRYCRKHAELARAGRLYAATVGMRRRPPIETDP